MGRDWLPDSRGWSIWSDGADLDSQLSTVEPETAEFEEPKAALEAGFQVAGPVAPGQGWHFINEDRVQAAAESGVSWKSPKYWRTIRR